MGKAKSRGLKFYAVRKGRTPGVYCSWDECKRQVDCFPGARHKKFASYNEAHRYVSGQATKTTISVASANPIHARAGRAVAVAYDNPSTAARPNFEVVTRRHSSFRSSDTKIKRTRTRRGRPSRQSDTNKSARSPHSDTGKNQKFFYSVHGGATSGVYTTWEDCEKQLKGVSDAKFKRFLVYGDALAFANGEPEETPVVTTVATPSKTSCTARGGVRAAPGSIAKEIKESRNNKFGPSIVVDGTVYDPEFVDIMYSDGACLNNGKIGSKGGIGVWYGPNDIRNLAERLPGVQTNNRAELLAIIRILEVHPENGRQIVILSDSQYAKDCVNKRLYQWHQDDWFKRDRSPVLNRDMIRYLASLLDLRHQLGQKPTLLKVRGHSKVMGNDGADELASIGAALPEIAEEPNWSAKRIALQIRIDASFAQKPCLAGNQLTVVPTEYDAIKAMLQRQQTPTWTAELTENDVYEIGDILDAQALDAELNDE